MRTDSLALRRAALVAVSAAAFLLPWQSVGTALAQTATPTAAFTPLHLLNGWKNAPSGTSNAAVRVISGIVHFKGAIGLGTSPVAFRLPRGFRPATAVYAPVDLCGAANGRLFISPSGVVQVQAEGSFTDAQCFTSLDGASFARSASGFTPLHLLNGWKNAPFATSKAEVRVISGIVHFKGAISSGTSAEVFRLPAAFRPATLVYAPVDMCNATNGRLVISPAGVVTVQAEAGFGEAHCFTSLDGAWFARSASGFTPLHLLNGWKNAPFSTSKAEVRVISGIVSFKGAIASGAVVALFRLPPALRPATRVYVQVDLCNATNGRLIIFPQGMVQVQAQTSFNEAHCFTSLDGVSFAR
jgi:hypothetical protein